MSEDDDVSKLHNKGIIVDGESVLVSSINMGSSAMNRNREMGVIIHSPMVTQYYLDGWYATGIAWTTSLILTKTH